MELEIVLNWFKSYLENTRVKFNDILSDSNNVDYGVPQGSVLEPLLFLIYINDITKIINVKCTISVFADDALIYTIGHSNMEISDHLNEQMVNVEEWLKINRLQLNIDKTKVKVLLRGIRKKTIEDNE